MNERADNAEDTASPVACAAVDPTLPQGWNADLDDSSLAISDDLPTNSPVSEAELDVIERYMGDILDLVLASRSAITSPEAKDHNDDE
jgi:hypothetical protein